MKKILFAVTGLGGGGAERVVSVWASQLAEKGYDVGIITYSKKDGEYTVDSKVKRLILADKIKDYLAMSYLKRYKLIRETVKKFSPDVIISFLPRMQIWMALATTGLNVKRIETVRNSPWNFYNGALTKQLWKLCFKTCDLAIVQSEDQKPFFSKAVQKKCVVVPNPLNESYEKEGKTEFAQKAIRFVSAGRLCKQKNFPLLIKAFAKVCETHPDITLDIYGKGTDEYAAELQTLIDELGVKEKIKLCGRTDNVHAVFMKHDAFIMSSDFEGMPNALAEAMAVGLVCISTDCRTGPHDLIMDKDNGFLVPVGDVDAMAESIKYVADMDAEMIKKIGVKARKFATDLCSRENSLKKLIEAIEK